jgi:hypothetical protein
MTSIHCRRSRIDLTSMATQSPNPWRLPLALFLLAFIGTVIFFWARVDIDQARGMTKPTVEAQAPHAEPRITDSATGAASVSSSARALAQKPSALQKPGPPDPVAEKTAAESAARAADAAADLAASAGSATN